MPQLWWKTHTIRRGSPGTTDQMACMLTLMPSLRYRLLHHRIVSAPISGRDKELSMQLYRLGLLLAAAILLGACGAASPATLTTQQLTVTANEFAYAPTTLEVTSGQPVEITLRRQALCRKCRGIRLPE